MPKEEQVTIFLTVPEAVQFRDYQKFHDVFLMMQQQGVFDIKYGKCTINFAEGVVQTVSKEEVIYRRP